MTGELVRTSEEVRPDVAPVTGSRRVALGLSRPTGRSALRGARMDAHLTLGSFAAAMGVSVSCASRWETGVRRPHIDDLRRIASLVDRPFGEVRTWFTVTPLSTEKLRDARGLRGLRVGAGLSRAELAAAVGVSPATIAHWECGRRALPARRWSHLADATGLTLMRFERAIRVEAHHPVPRPLTTLRRRRGLSQRKVGLALGVSGGLVSRWERGAQVPGWPNVRRLALLLGVPLELVAQAVGRTPPVYVTKLQGAPLGPALREVRLWRGESRLVVARRTGVHSETLRRWESGLTTPPDRRLVDLERALGLPAAALAR